MLHLHIEINIAKPADVFTKTCAPKNIGKPAEMLKNVEKPVKKPAEDAMRT